MINIAEKTLTQHSESIEQIELVLQSRVWAPANDVLMYISGKRIRMARNKHTALSTKK
jgi:ribosomal protein L19